MASSALELQAHSAHIDKAQAFARDIERLQSRWLGGLSVSSRRAYHSDVKDWRAWCELNYVAPLEATSLDGTAWLDSLSHLSVSTRKRKLAGVASFYAWLREEGATDADPRPKRSQRPKVQGEDSQKLVGLDRKAAVALLRKADDHSPRMSAYVALSLTTGLRVAELASLRPADVKRDSGGRTVATISGKGERVRSVVIPPLAVERLEAIAPEDATDCYFRTRTGAQWKPDGIRDALAILGKSVEIQADDGSVFTLEGLHPHALRHTAASMALAAGSNVESVRAMLGHASLSTTQRYVTAAGALDNSPALVLASKLAS